MKATNKRAHRKSSFSMLLHQHKTLAPDMLLWQTTRIIIVVALDLQIWLKSVDIDGAERAQSISSIFNRLFLLQQCLQTWVRYVSVSSLLFNIFCNFTFPGFPWFTNQEMKSQFKVTLVDHLKSTYGTNVFCWWGRFSHKHSREIFDAVLFDLDGVMVTR